MHTTKVTPKGAPSSWPRTAKPARKTRPARRAWWPSFTTCRRQARRAWQRRTLHCSARAARAWIALCLATLSASCAAPGCPDLHLKKELTKPVVYPVLGGETWRDLVDLTLAQGAQLHTCNARFKGLRERYSRGQ